MYITKPKIVIVDDDLDNLDILCCELSDFYEIYPVSDGFFAVQVVEDVHPDLIILDFMMFQLQGNLLVPPEPVHPKFEGIPVLFAMGTGNSARKIQPQTRNFMNCLIKPYDIDEVLTKIGRYIPPFS